MSYILDALKRADAERERGAVPGLHTHAFPLDSAATRAGHRSIPWLGIGIGLAVALLAMMAWQLMGNDAPRETAAPAVTMPAPPPTPAPTPVATAPAPPPVPVAAVPVAPPEPMAAVAEPAPVKSVPAPTAAAAAKTKPSRGNTRPTEAAPAGPVVTRSELPENIRRELPTLAIGGAIHSANPANRMLIINGQLFHEGDKLGTDLTLEQIKLRAAVLKYKDYRYTVSF